MDAFIACASSPHHPLQHTHIHKYAYPYIPIYAKSMPLTQTETYTRGCRSSQIHSLIYSFIQHIKYLLPLVVRRMYLCYFCSLSNIYVYVYSKHHDKTTNCGNAFYIIIQYHLLFLHAHSVYWWYRR